MKKLTSVLLVIGMLTALMAGCGSTEAKPSAAPSAAPTAAPEANDDNLGGGAATAGAALNVAIISSPSGVDDGSFNEDNYNGILQFIAENPDTKVTPIREENSANAVQAVADVVADYDVLVCTGFQFAGIGTLAEENPDAMFILVDSAPVDAEGNAVELPNIYSMQFAEQESGFFAGLAAAHESKTGKVAVVNGVAYPSNVNYQYGFEAGVAYAAAHQGTSTVCVELPSYAGIDVTGTDVGGNYVGAFDDEATGKVVGETLISEGVDIIFVAAGGSGNGVFTAVKESDSAMVIGCDVDQYDDGETGTRNIMLTSGLKVMSLNVYRQLNAIADGSFAGANVVLAADTQSTGYVSADGRHQMSDETMTAVAEGYDLVCDGTIVPPSNFGGTLPEDFVGLN